MNERVTGIISRAEERPLEVGVRRVEAARPLAHPVSTRAWLSTLASLALPACAAALWVASLPHIPYTRMNDFGLTSVLPLSYYAALLLLTVSFAFLVSRKGTYSPVLLVHVGLFILIVHGTPAIIYDTLRYSWTWKHLGIIDYIQRHGSVNPGISYLNVYHNWPGFFAAAALMDEAAGLKSAMTYANWAPAFFNLIDVVALLLIFKSWTTDQRRIWCGVWFFVLGNWIGQDYFSPQATCFFLYLVAVGITVRWFVPSEPGSPPSITRWRAINAITRSIDRIARWSRTDEVPDPQPRLLQYQTLVVIVFLLLFVIASSHQLTPFMALSAFTGLVLFQQCRVRSLPLVTALLTFGWVLYGASVFLQQNVSQILGPILQWSRNVDSSLVNLSNIPRDQQLIAYATRGTTGLMWGLALLGAVRRFRLGYRDLSCIILALTPFPWLIVGRYGTEMLHRITLFALPFMAFLAAALLYPRLRPPSSWRTTGMTLILSLLLLSGLLVTYYGHEQMNYFTKNEVAASQYLFTTAPKGSLVMEGSTNYPSLWFNYERYTHVAIARLFKKDRLYITRRPVRVLRAWMDNPRYPASYLIITRSQKSEIRQLGLMLPGAMNRIERALLHSRYFRVVYANRDATIFTLVHHPRTARHGR